MNGQEILKNAWMRPITEREALELFYASEEEAFCQELFATARGVRKKAQGDRFYFSGGISNVLPCNLRPLCLYCPYWRGEDRHSLTVPEIVSAAQWLHGIGIREFHLSGGTTLGSQGRDVLAIVRAIWDSGLRDMHIVVNCGASMSLDTLRELGQLGVKRVGAVFETLSPTAFCQLKPGDDLEKKLAFAHDIGKAGLALSSGLMAGITPSDTRYEDYAFSLARLQEFEHLRYIYISKFCPDETIPMKDHPPCPLDEALRLIAIARLALPSIIIRAAAGWREEQQEATLNAGCAGDLCVCMTHRGRGCWGREGSTELIFMDRRQEREKTLSKLGLKVEHVTL